jgi:hypothetical protein
MTPLVANQPSSKCIAISLRAISTVDRLLMLQHIRCMIAIDSYWQRDLSRYCQWKTVLKLSLIPLQATHAIMVDLVQYRLLHIGA